MKHQLHQPPSGRPIPSSVPAVLPVLLLSLGQLWVPATHPSLLATVLVVTLSSPAKVLAEHHVEAAGENSVETRTVATKHCQDLAEANQDLVVRVAVCAGACYLRLVAVHHQRG